MRSLNNFYFTSIYIIEIIMLTSHNFIEYASEDLNPSNEFDLNLILYFKKKKIFF